jgi:hypothetical protein
MIKMVKAALLCGLVATAIYAEDEDTSLLFDGFDMSGADSVQVITTAGDTISGINKAANKFGSTYKSIKVRDAAGTLHKFKLPADLKQITVYNYSALKGSGSFRKPDGAVIYLTVDYIGKSGKKVVVQQLNYEGTDKILLYNNPDESGWDTYPFTPIQYLEVEGYYISLNGGELFAMTDKEYEKKGGFEKLFGESKEMMAKYPTKKERDFEDFDEHLKMFLNL